MDEIRGRLLIGGMVLRNLEGALDTGAQDSEAGWTGVLLISPPLHESLQTGRSYRLELEDERAAQVEVTGIAGIPGQSRLRVVIRGQTPLKWSPYAHEVHHSAVIAPFSELVPTEI